MPPRNQPGQCLRCRCRVEPPLQVCHACRDAVAPLFLANRRLAPWMVSFLENGPLGHVVRAMPAGAALAAAEMGLWRACLLFDPSRGKISTYAAHAMRRQVLDDAKWVGPFHVPSCPRGPYPGVVALPEAYDDQPLTAPGEGPAATVARRDEVRRALAALGELPRRLAQAVRLRLLEGLTLQAVGERLRVTKEGARLLIGKGLRLLRAALGAPLVPPGKRKRRRKKAPAA